MIGYPKSSIAFSIFSIVTASESKFAFTLLELNITFTLSFSTPFNPFTALSIFCKHDGQDKVSN